MDFSGPGLKSDTSEPSLATWKNLSVVNTICISSFRYSCDYLKKSSIKVNMTTGEGKQLNGNVTLNKRWNWSSCTKLALNGSWTHHLIVQFVRASERNSVAVASNLTEINLLKLLQRIFQWWILYVSVHSPTLIWLLTRNFDKINVTTDECKQLKWNVALNKRWNSSSCRKLFLSASWTQGLVADSLRAFEWKSVVMDSDSTQPTFL